MTERIISEMEHGFIITEGDIGRIIFDNGDARDIDIHKHSGLFKRVLKEGEKIEVNKDGKSTIVRREQKIEIPKLEPRKRIDNKRKGFFK